MLVVARVHSGMQPPLLSSEPNFLLSLETAMSIEEARPTFEIWHANYPERSGAMVHLLMAGNSGRLRLPYEVEIQNSLRVLWEKAARLS